jgi:hypothetical protein
VRVIRDGVGNITQGDQTLHSNVRYQVDDKHRVAVFASSQVVGPPVAVYQEGEVLYTLLRKPCSCKKDAAKMRLTQAWMSFDKAQSVDA